MALRIKVSMFGYFQECRFDELDANGIGNGIQFVVIMAFKGCQECIVERIVFGNTGRTVMAETCLRFVNGDGLCGRSGCVCVCSC